MTTDIIANPLEIGHDEAERLALEECVKRQRVDRRVSVLVIPAGDCEQAAKFARLGAQVTVTDDPARQAHVEGRLLATGLGDEISYIPASVSALPDNLPREPYDIIVVRRGLSRMRYEEARQIVHQLLLKLKIGGKLYVSLLGLHSELGEGYAGDGHDIGQRFAPLAPALAGKYNIPGDICLYTERNLFMLLLEAGGSVLRTLTTTYGHIKGVAVRV